MIEAVKWEKPDGFTLETVLCDGKGGLYLLSDKQTYHMAKGARPALFAEVGSYAGAVCLAPDGSLIVGDRKQIWRVSAGRKVTKVAAGFSDVYGVAADKAGNVYAADPGADRVARVAPDGTVQTLAAGLKEPSGIVLDAEGNLYVRQYSRSHDPAPQVTKITHEGKASRFATIRP